MQVTEATKAHAQAIVDYIIENPEKHDQRLWWMDNEKSPINGSDFNFCDTTMCIAGTSVFIEGGVEALIEQSQIGDWEIAAAPNLGLTDREASYLFYCMDNDLAVDAVNAIAQGDVDKFYEILEIRGLN